MADTDTVQIVGLGEIESTEPTALLRWVPLSSLQGHRKKLQQGWRISTLDNDGRVIVSRIEWRDIPDAFET